MKTPPLLPEETLRRVVRVANMEGMSVLAIAGMLALASASIGDYQGTAVGLLVAATGAIELHGAALLLAGESRGTKWLIFSQPYLMAIVLTYCALRLTHYDQPMLDLIQQAAHRAYGSQTAEIIASTGHNEAEFCRMMYRTLFTALAFGTLLYQGLMMLYYWRRRPALIVAVESIAPSTD